ncbi:urease accessory protein UreD [Celeribacter sp.]|uniref:urease accessory protein UreD n=1 Tax=Celeribacter sp. TaxID=1890673 RepID=UPI003A910D78
MLDTTRPVIPSPAARMQRVKGRAHVVVGPNGLRDLAQSGSAKAMLPRVHSATPEVVFLNTSGGLTGGDVLDYTLEAEDGAALTGASQTAERAYAATVDALPASVSIRLKAGRGATLNWLPQETILFEGAALERTTCADLAADARFLFVETVVLGRAAMGESLHRLTFRDRREVRRGGRLDYLEPLEINASTLATRDNAVTLAGARAVATIGLFDQGAEDLAEALRDVTQEGVTAGVSGWNGKLVIRAMAADGYPLRRYVAQTIEKLTRGPLPRVWQI